MAYVSPAVELLYGGAAGGGKTQLLLGKARTRHRRALLLRRTYKDLERTLVFDSKQFYGPEVQYNAGKHLWSIDGRVIEFGHMDRMGSAPERPGDETNYAGAPYDYLGWDQLEQFNQYVYTFMLSRLRTSLPDQPVQSMATANPVGEYVQWIIERWGAWLQTGHSNPAQPGELRWYKGDPDGKGEVECAPGDPNGISRTFIPAKLKDNPYYGDDYRRVLNLLPEPLRSALLEGDFAAARTDDAYQVIPSAWVRLAQQRWPAAREALRRHFEELQKANALTNAPVRLLSAIGVDVARGGDDDTVLAPRYGTYFAELRVAPGRVTDDGPSVVALFAPILAAEGGVANIDVVGIGSSAYDHARLLKLNVRAVNFASKSMARDKSGVLQFVNKRAEAYWKFREALDPANGDGLALPPDPMLLADLTEPRYTIQANGVKIEEKDAVKARLGRSPDRGDAVVMAYMATGVNFG